MTETKPKDGVKLCRLSVTISGHHLWIEIPETDQATELKELNAADKCLTNVIDGWTYWKMAANAART